MISLKDANERLLAYYGNHAEFSLPKFRIIWSDDEFEMRHGDFVKFDENGNDIGMESTVKSCPKYPWIKGRHIFEALFVNVNPELIGKHSYECLYVFQDVQENRLPLKWEAVEFIIKALRTQVTKKTEKTMSEEEDAKWEKQTQLNLDFIEDLIPTTVSKVDSGEGVFVPSTYGDKK